jgi:hypothetical protein
MIRPVVCAIETKDVVITVATSTTNKTAEPFSCWMKREREEIFKLRRWPELAQQTQQLDPHQDSLRAHLWQHGLDLKSL